MKTKESILREHLEKADCLWDEGYEHEFKAVNTPNTILEAAMEEYAKQESIEFAKWLNKEGWEEYDDSNTWICPSNNRSIYFTSDIYEMFKKPTHEHYPPA